MSNDLSRAQWVFTALGAILLALIAGLVLLVQAGQSMSMGPDLDAVPGQFEAAGQSNALGRLNAPASPAPPLTAQVAYETALPIARAWSQDAQLWTLEASWPTGSDLRQPPAAWTLTFYAPELHAASAVMVTAASAVPLGERAIAAAPNLADLDGWRLDSPAAFEQLHANGGEAFLTVHPNRTLILTLHAGAPLRWRATIINEGPLGNRAGRQIFTLLFSAEDGHLITTPVEEGAGD